MPVVPTLPERTVEPAQIGGISLPSFQSPAAPDAALKLLQTERQKVNQLVVLDADNQIAEFQTQLQTDLLSRQGKNAFGNLNEARTKWQAFQDKTLAGLTDEAQRRSVQGRFQARWADLNEVVQRHMAQQHIAFDNTTTADSIALSQQRVLQNYLDPIKIQQEADFQDSVIKDAANRHGIDPAWALTQNTSDRHLIIVGQMIEHGQWLQAKAYMDAIPQGTITPEDVLRFIGAYTTAQANQDKAMKAEKDASVLQDTIKAASGQLTLDDLTLNANHFQYTNEDYAKLKSDIERGGTTNPSVLLHFETAIRTGQPTTFRDLSGRTDLSNPDKIRLMGLLDEQSKSDHFSKTPVYEQAVKELRTAVTRKGPLESLDPQEQKTLLYTTQELWDRTAKGENPLTVSRELIKRIPQEEGFGVGPPALLPKYQTEDELVNAFKQGQITQQEFNNEALLFKQLREKEAIQQNVAERKKRLEQGRTR